MTAITTADVRTYIAQRQAETTRIVRAHDVVRKDGTVRHVPNAAARWTSCRMPRSTGS
jgi:hypothetical protein